jgi:hypothetical protein
MGGIPLPQAQGPEITQITSKKEKKTSLNSESRSNSTNGIFLLIFNTSEGFNLIFSRKMGEMADS